MAFDLELGVVSVPLPNTTVDLKLSYLAAGVGVPGPRYAPPIGMRTRTAPIGAAMTATVIPTSEGSMAELTVFGLLPNRSYAAYAYTKACGATADAAGRRFQNHLDPAASAQAGSTNPENANPENEIWLDVRTDAAGAGNSRARVPFALSDRTPGSLVVDDAEGNAGVRVACLTLSRR
jgi:superoxide dismutase, Cu-Zn family